MTIKQLILEKILEFGEGTLNAFFPAKYPEARVWRSLLGLDDNYKFSRRNFSRTLSDLNKAGFVRRAGSKKKASWQITEKGEKYIKSLPKRNPVLQEDGKMRLVVFDVPEPERAKRRWLRGRLMELNYVPVQRSVWLGKAILPAQFFSDLSEFGVSQYVHIFDIIDKYSE